MEKYTDLAVECYEEAEKTVIDGVKITEENDITTVRVLDKNGERALGKPVGNYLTFSVKSIAQGSDLFDGRIGTLSGLLSSLLPKRLDSALVVGLGNTAITADALGPMVNKYVLATRHIIDDKSDIFKDFFKVSAIDTGVLGNTGIESAELVKGVVNTIKPSVVIAVDALSACSAERLGTTVQLSDTGISPGSGVGNHRNEISESTLGVPVVSIGIPTVVSTSLLGDNDDGMYVTPREIDRIIEHGSRLIGMSINTCLQKNLSEQELFSLVG